MTDRNRPTHTPGPWTTEAQSIPMKGTWFVLDDAAESGAKLVAECNGPGAEQRARLIAAAPETAAELARVTAERDALLEAADFMLPYLEAEIEAERDNAADGVEEAGPRADFLEQQANRFRAAIAKAEGRE